MKLVALWELVSRCPRSVAFLDLWQVDISLMRWVPGSPYWLGASRHVGGVRA